MTPPAFQKEALLEKVRELPALPQVVLDLMAAFRREDVPMEQLATKLSRDQALTAKTLRLANSSFYGVAGRVASIRDALSILGLRTLSTVATTAAVMSSFERTACTGFDFDAFWRHSIATALCAQSLAELLDIHPGSAFTAGLLHDIGRLALASHFPEELGLAISWRIQHDVLALEAEQQILGIDHAAVGGMIAAHWRFTPDIVEAIQLHHDVPPHRKPALVDLAHLADNITHALDLSQEGDDMVPPISLDTWERLNLTPQQMEQVFKRTESQVKGICDALTQ
jgi:putative nucleotidyltransferase with HDIG domain